MYSENIDCFKIFHSAQRHRLKKILTVILMFLTHAFWQMLRPNEQFNDIVTGLTLGVIAFYDKSGELSFSAWAVFIRYEYCADGNNKICFEGLYLFM